MATTELKTRLVLCSKVEADWEKDTTVILNGEVAISSDKRKVKFGNGVGKWSELAYATLTPEEVQSLITAAQHTHTNKAILDATTASFTQALLTKLNGIADGANKITVDSSISATSTNPVQNKVIKSQLDAKVPTTRKVNNKALSADITLTATDVGAIPTSAKGVAGGVATLGTDGKVPAAQLPSYVDDVVEGYLNATDGKFYKSRSGSAEAGYTYATAITAETDKIYTDISSKKIYRYSGSTYVVISDTIALGETSSTAYRGDRGKVAYDHSQAAHAPSNAEKNAIISVKQNGTALSIGTDRSVNVTVPTKVSELTNDSNFITSSANVASATKLATARSIDGVKFDGSAAIHHYAECTTAAATAAKVVTMTGYELATGSRITVKFTVTNTVANPTLNVNSTGAKAIRYRGSNISAGSLAANRVYEFVYDGTYWNLIGDLDTNTTYSGEKGITLTSGKFGHTNSVTAGTAQGSATKTLTYGSTFTIPTVTYDAYGHITGTGTTTMTMPAAVTTISGNAGSATKLANARNFSITGAVTAAAVSFDGTQNVTLSATAINLAKAYVNADDTVILNGSF